MDRSPNANLADIAYTLHFGREQLPHRINVVAADPREASLALRLATPVAAAAIPSVLLLLPNRDPRAIATVRVLREVSPIFGAHFTLIAKRIRGAGGPDLLMRCDKPEAARDDSDFATLALSLALVRTLADMGFMPDAYSGEGLGEWAAAMLAGVLDQDTGIAAICQELARPTRLKDEATIQIALSAAAVASQLVPELAVKAIVSRASTVVAGPRVSIERLCARLDQMGIPWEPVKQDEGAGLLPSPAPRVSQNLVCGIATAAWLSPTAGRVL
jgi:acyl transferase domain-containing protein